jgi:hypothetical protein
VVAGPGGQWRGAGGRGGSEAVAASGADWRADQHSDAHGLTRFKLKSEFKRGQI